MNPPAPYPALEAAAQGATVLTANKRLSGVLRRLYAVRQQAEGRLAWETPDILPWSAWLQREWEALALGTATGAAGPTGLLLNPLQEHALWRRVVSSSEAGAALLQPDATARLAAEARSLQLGWRVDLASDPHLLGRDARAFLDWSGDFERRCEAHGWLDRARLPDLLASAYREGVLPSLDRIHLAGFDEITPQQRTLLETLERAGVTIGIEPVPARDSPATRQAFADLEAEIVAAGRWARRRFEEGSASIAIVVPELAACRALVLRVLDDVLAPGAVLPGGAGSPPAYNLSLGIPLADCPVVHDALVALGTLVADASPAQAGALLRSPFIAGGEAEMTARGVLDARLREGGEPRVPIDLLEALAKGSCGRLAAALGRWRRGAEALPARQRPSAWAESLLRLLRELGWPGERVIVSEEYQAVEAWRELVSSLSCLDPVVPSMTLGECLSNLARISAERIFQPEAPECPIQVLGMLEAAGMRFDHLWVVGVHDEIWPPPPDPNPFLPLASQRRHGLPRATPERELEVADRVTARLRAAAPEVRFSHPLGEGDRPLRVSPLIAGLPEAPPGPGGQMAFYRDRIHAASRLETIEDSVAPALREGEVLGGSALFRLQAACPFRAFAELRLHARPLGEAAMGPDAAERGTLMHRALERLWSALGGSEALHRLDAAGEEALVGRIVDEALGEAAAQRPRLYARKFTELERWRMRRRLRAWLAVERRRAPFVVEAMEERRRVAVGGLEVEIKIDRIDRLADGRRLVIDYKTGAVALDQWFGDRPDEPQLPLYSLALGDELEAVLFACLKAGETGYVGVTDKADAMPDEGGVKVYAETRHARDTDGSWPGQRRAWSKALEALARGFLSGDAAVDPKRYPKTCGYCGLTSLCRVNDAAMLPDDDPGGPP